MYLNYRRSVIAGATAALIIGAGGTSLALTGSNSDPSPSGTTGQHMKDGKHGQQGQRGKHGDKRDGGKRLLKRLEHAQITTQGKKGAVTHNLIRGTVTAVSPTSITVAAKDKVSETFVITKDTKFRERTKGQKPAESSVAKIAKGDTVFVAGTGTTKPTAKHVVETPK